MTGTRVSSLAGVPILNDRDPVSNYGRTGYAIHPYLDAEFAAQADSALAETFISLSASNVGDVRAILCGNLSVVGGARSYRGGRRAFDLDGLEFSTGRIWAANSFPSRRFEYLLIEAHLRRHFGTVLTCGFDDRFRDRIYFDNGDPVGFRPHSKSRAIFLQNALRYLFDEILEADGVYGPETQHAERMVRKSLGIGPFSTVANWLAFLAASIEATEERLSSPTILEAFG